MAETISVVNNLSKEEKYNQLIPQVKALVDGETNRIANMANVCAALKEVFDFFWIGFYLVENDQLVLGPFQGPVACTRIAKGKGVCGTAWNENKTMLIPDVDQFPGHIACSAQSKSEIVLPFYNGQNQIAGVLDIDSDQLETFDETDSQFLENLLNEIREALN
ncbi:GAF domain-containing protein [Salibacter halophilus]|uniref:GAF domain-containing protein n=1 Tax=Salibacter halophilus TaxID=1803916 RepID=A0A6N6M4C6_9FLAO|nr:GAF domain-containing protein [Salibacter halophilus]KAB1064044.1 GAF domain-containing protein [Salibacter halophilus]